MGRKSQRKGATAERLAVRVLSVGQRVTLIRHIATPYRVVSQAPCFRCGSTTKRVIRDRPVPGDIWGVMGDGSGRAVLVEVKATPDRLSVSDFRRNDHDQLPDLEAYHAAGVVVLVFWVHDNYTNGLDGYTIMRVPLTGLRKGKPIHADRAESYAWDWST